MADRLSQEVAAPGFPSKLIVMTGVLLSMQQTLRASESQGAGVGCRMGWRVVLKHRSLALTPRVSDSVGLGCGLRPCMSLMFPGDADIASPETTSGEAPLYSILPGYSLAEGSHGDWFRGPSGEWGSLHFGSQVMPMLLARCHTLSTSPCARMLGNEKSRQAAP